MAPIVLCMKCLQSKQNISGCVLTSSPRSVDVKSFFQISCVCFALIADLLLCFGFPQPLSTHSYNTWVLAPSIPIIMYQVHIHVRKKPQLVSIIHSMRSACSYSDRKCVTTAGSYIRIATCLPITIVVC